MEYDPPTLKQGGGPMRCVVIMPFVLALSSFLWPCAASVPGADLANIDRSLKKEPAYKSKPKYCLIVFGPEVTARVWMVLDEDTLYVDRDGNGDLTGADEKVKLPPMKPLKPLEGGVIEAMR